MSKDKHLLFFGELPPHSVHGIAISNKINLEILKSSFVIATIEEFSKVIYHDKISFHKIFSLSRNNLAIIAKAISQHFNYFYLVYSLSTLGSLKTLIAILCFRLFNKGQVVLHIHRGDFISRYYMSLINKIMAKLIIGLSHRVIVLSETQKKAYKAIFNKSFYVLNNTTEVEYPVSKVSRKKCKFIFISNYFLDKGILDLLEVFSELSRNYVEISLQTYGAFSDSSLKDTMLKYNSENIQINGLISGKHKYDVIAHSDCLILPSWNEGQPLVLLEAMQVGTPVIASRVGLIPEMLGKDYPFLIIPRDRDSLKEKIIQFVNQDDSLNISKKLVNIYRNRYSQDIHESCLRNIFV